jgi:hypothetical protein
MKYAFAIVYLLLFYGWILPAMAQNKAKTPASTTPPASSAPASTPTATPATNAEIPVPPKSALAIRDAQVETLSEQTQAQQHIQLRDAAQQKMQAAIKAAYAEAKLSDADYSIDDHRWVWVPIPKPPATPAPTPTPAAGAKK